MLGPNVDRVLHRLVYLTGRLRRAEIISRHLLIVQHDDLQHFSESGRILPHIARHDLVGFVWMGGDILHSGIPSLCERLELFFPTVEDPCRGHQAVNDQTGMVRIVDQQVAMRSILGLGEERFVSHRGIDLLQQKGLGSILGRQIHDRDIGLAEAQLLEQDVQVELLKTAAQSCYGLAFEIGHGLHVLGGDDASATAVVIEREHARQRLLIGLRIARGVLHDACDRIDLATEQPAEGGCVDLVVDQLDLDPFLGEEALLLGEEQRPVAHPREIEDPQRLGLGDAREAGGDADGCCQADRPMPSSHFSASFNPDRCETSLALLFVENPMRDHVGRRHLHLQYTELRPDVDGLLHRPISLTGFLTCSWRERSFGQEPGW